jgi:hypothetical protein
MRDRPDVGVGDAVQGRRLRRHGERTFEGSGATPGVNGRNATYRRKDEEEVACAVRIR